MIILIFFVSLIYPFGHVLIYISIVFLNMFIKMSFSSELTKHSSIKLNVIKHANNIKAVHKKNCVHINHCC